MNNIIGIDLDGVVVDICVPIINYLARKKHIKYTREDFTHYNTYEWANVTKEEMGELFSKISSYRDAPFMPNAKTRLHWLWYLGYRLVAVTSRPQPVRKYTETWIRKENLPFERVIFSNAHTKIDIAREEGMEIFIEDHPVTAQQLTSVCDRTFLFDAKYNRYVEESQKLVRVHDWIDIHNLLVYGCK